MVLFHQEMGIFRTRNRDRLTLCLAFVGYFAFANNPMGAAGPLFSHTECKVVDLVDQSNGSLVRGAEALVLSDDRSTIFVSAYDRRSTTERGIPPEGGVYSLNVQALKTRHRVEVVSLDQGLAIPGGFRPHGLALFESSDGNARLAIINRRYFDKAPGKRTYRPGIELFQKSSEGWRYERTIEDPDLCRANDLDFVNADTLVVSIDRSSCADFTVNEDVFGFPGGHLVKVEIGPESGADIVSNIATPLLDFPNGVVSDHRTGAVHVATTKGASILSFDREALLSDGLSIKPRIRSLSEHPDNLSVMKPPQDGEMIVSVYPDLPAFAAYRYRWFGRDKSASKIIGINNEGVTRVLFDDPEGAIFSAASSAILDEILIAGSVGDEGLLVCQK